MFVSLEADCEVCSCEKMATAVLRGVLSLLSFTQLFSA